MGSAGHVRTKKKKLSIHTLTISQRGHILFYYSELFVRAPDGRSWVSSSLRPYNHKVVYCLSKPGEDHVVTCCLETKTADDVNMVHRNSMAY